MRAQLYFFCSLLLVAVCMAVPHNAQAQVCTPANCVGCEQSFTDDNEFTTQKNEMDPQFTTSYEKISKALDAMQTAIVKAIQTAGTTKIDLAITEMTQKTKIATHTNQQQANISANTAMHDFKQATTPTVDECVETNNANQVINGVQLREVYVSAAGRENIETINPNVKLYQDALKAGQKGFDYLGVKINTNAMADIADIIGYKAPPPTRRADGQCLAGGAAFELIGAKYGFVKTSDTTDIDSHASHTGGAVDFRYSDDKIKNAITNPNSQDAQDLKTALNAMSQMGASLIQFENAATKSTWSWNGSKFVDTGNKLPANFTGSHIHVGNSNFVNTPVDCAKLEAYTGKTVEQIDAETTADIANAVNAQCKKYPFSGTPCAQGQHGSMQCKCDRARTALMATASRSAVLTAKLQDNFVGNTAYNSSSTIGDDTQEKSAMDRLFHTAIFTGKGGFTIGETQGKESISMLTALLNSEFVDPDYRPNAQAAKGSASGRTALTAHYKDAMKANIRAAIVAQMASYQMPVMQGGKEAIETMVANILSDNPTDSEKKSLLTMANKLVGPNDTLSLSAMAKVNVVQFTSYNYQQNAAMNPSKTGLQFLFVLTKQVREKMRQLHMLQMINLMKSIELAQSTGA